MGRRRATPLIQCKNTVNLIIDPKCWRTLLPALLGITLGMSICMMHVVYHEMSCVFEPQQDPQGKLYIQDALKLESEKSPENVPPKKLVRTRYVSMELGIRERLFIAVLTSKNTIETLGVAINKTGQQQSLKMVFFMEEQGKTNFPSMSVVSFMDNKPHLLPIHVLRYLVEHYLDSYDYYLFVSDKTYFRSEKLVDLVHHISVTQQVYMGSSQMMQDGSGYYCPLDGGVILSQSILSRVSSKFEWCNANCLSSDPSLNFGLFLQHFSDMNCEDHAGTKSYATHKVTDFNFDNEISKLNQMKLIEEFNNSLTVYPVPDVNYHFNLHRYFCQLEIDEMLKDIENTKDSVLHLGQFTPGGLNSSYWPIGVPDRYTTKSRFEVIRWDYFTETHIYFKDEYENIEELEGEVEMDIEEVIKISVNRLNEKYGYIFLYSKLINGYRRFDPERGVEYIMDLILLDISKQNSKVEKRVHVVRPMGKIEVVALPVVMENQQINMILPITESEIAEAATFLEFYAKTCLDKHSDTHLIIVLVYNHEIPKGSNDVFSNLKSLVGNYKRKYHNPGIISWSSIVYYEEYMSELFVIDNIIGSLPSTSLILVCSVGMELSAEYLNRVRMNTIKGWQVFFPVGFWQYKPNLVYEEKPYPKKVVLNGKSGHYSAYSYDHSSFFISDYNNMRKLITEEEARENDLYDLFIKTQQLLVFRAIEPLLRLRFKNLTCPASAPYKKFQRCLKRRSYNMAARGRLAELVYQQVESFGEDSQLIAGA